MPFCVSADRSGEKHHRPHKKISRHIRNVAASFGPMTEEKPISIVIITRNTKELVKGLLASIGRDYSLVSRTLDTVVVDNASSDGTGDVIRQDFPSTVYMREERNVGFAKAANIGYRNTGGQYVLFLNSDILVTEGEVVKMVDFMDQNPDIAILGPQLVHSNYTFQRSFANAPTLLLEVIPERVARYLAPKRYPDPKKHYPEPINVQSLIGAAIIARRDVLDRLNGFDERFFFFLEETDLCLRASDSGYRIVFFPGSSIVHLQGKTVARSWIPGRIEYNISLRKFIAKHHPAIYAGLFQGVRFIKGFSFLIFLTVFFPLLIKKKTRKRYWYYVYLFLWYLKGCRDDAGLQAKSPG